MRRIELGTLMTDRVAYVMPSQQGDKPDQIEVPAEEMERLSMRGVKGDSTGCSHSAVPSGLSLESRQHQESVSPS